MLYYRLLSKYPEKAGKTASSSEKACPFGAPVPFAPLAKAAFRPELSRRPLSLPFSVCGAGLDFFSVSDFRRTEEGKKCHHEAELLCVVDLLHGLGGLKNQPHGYLFRRFLPHDASS